SAGVQLLEVLLVVVLIDDDQARVGPCVPGSLGRGVDPEEDRERGRVADALDRRDDREAFGAVALGPARRVGVVHERENRDPVALGDRLAEAPSPGHWRGSYCGREALTDRSGARPSSARG